MAAALHECGIRVAVMNPLFIKQSDGGSIRKVKTDKGGQHENRQVRFCQLGGSTGIYPWETIREQLKLYACQYNLYMKNVVALQNNLISFCKFGFIPFSAPQNFSCFWVLLAGSVFSNKPT